MLPLALYFSDEFRLLSAAQLLRAVHQATFCDSAPLLADIEQLGILSGSTLVNDAWQAIDVNTSGLPAFLPPDELPEIKTSLQANRQFNIYLKQIESLTAPAQLIVDPFALHPGCFPLPDASVLDTLTRKLTALVQIAAGRQLTLTLTQPTEEQLETWLQIAARLSTEPTLADHPLGLCLSATSKRLLPTLAYLHHLGEEQARQFRINLLEQPYRSGQAWPFSDDSPSLHASAAQAMHYAAACAFLASENNWHLQPTLLLHSQQLLTLLQPLIDDTRWPVQRLHQMQPLPPPDSLTALTAPCLLPGLTLAWQPPQDNRLSPTSSQWRHATPIIDGQHTTEQPEQPRYCPADLRHTVGYLTASTETQIRHAFTVCSDARRSWHELPLHQRKDRITSFANALAQHQMELALLAAGETGIPVNACLLEVQEALQLIQLNLQQIDTALAAQTLPMLINSQPSSEQGATPTQHTLRALPRGTLLGLLAGNQPFVPFASQVSAALLTGNALLLNSATEIALTTARLFELLLQAQIPRDLIALLPGELDKIGATLLDDYRLDGVLFNGSPATAAEVQRHLAQRVGAAPLPLWTETGGRHAIILDRDTNPEQLLPDLLQAALAHNGQHPGALRVLYLEQEIAAQVETLLAQTLPWIRLGEPESRLTELGPLLNREQMDRAYLHIERLSAQGRLIAQQTLPDKWQESYFVPTTLLRLYSLDELQEAVDGPIIHLIRFDRDEIERTVDEINRSSFALALTLYSHDNALSDLIYQHAQLSELNLNPRSLQADPCAYPRPGNGRSGTAARPGSADYLKALLRYQLLSK